MASYFLLSFAFLLLGALSLILNLFNNVQPEPYMDEIFHLPQVQAYCAGNYSHWDPMITTLPGLYLTSLGLVAGLEHVSHAISTLTGFVPTLHIAFSTSSFCGTEILRYHNVILAVANLVILYKIVRTLNRGQSEEFSSKQASDVVERERKDSVQEIFEHKRKSGSVGNRRSDSLLLALNLTSLPLLFFFSFLYYTDVGAVCFVLLGYWLSLLDRHFASALAFSLSIFYRQTNVVWAAFAAGTVLLRNTTDDAKSLKAKGVIPALNLAWKLLPYAVIGIGFFVFVYINEGIVVGDRSHHEVCLHLPQFFYFFAFLSFFSFSHILLPLSDLAGFMKKATNYLLIALLSVLGLLAVQHFTYEHKYLLADNRHYPFYVWKNVFRRNALSRYLLVPLYSVAVVHWGRRLLQRQSVLWMAGLMFCIAASTVPQKLLEFRYFVLPYLFTRLHCPVRSRSALYLELLLSFAVNCATIYVFLYAPFRWPNSDNLQRFMW